MRLHTPPPPSPLALAETVFDFKSNQNGINDPKENKNITRGLSFCSLEVVKRLPVLYYMMKYGEPSYDRYRTKTSYDEVRGAVLRPLQNKNLNTCFYLVLNLCTLTNTILLFLYHILLLFLLSPIFLLYCTGALTSCNTRNR